MRNLEQSGRLLASRLSLERRKGSGVFPKEDVPSRERKMITWIYGESGAGKTTLAKNLLSNKTIHLDGDDMRESISKGLGFSNEDRLENNLRIARLAKVLDRQGFDVVVSTICPTPEMRQQVFWITKCRFVKIEGGFIHEIKKN